VGDDANQKMNSAASIGLRTTKKKAFMVEDVPQRYFPNL
jgi:hypothetical protein